MEKDPGNSANTTQWDNMDSIATRHEFEEAVAERIDSEDPRFEEVVDEVMSLAEEKGRNGEDYTREELVTEIIGEDDDTEENDSSDDLQKDDVVDQSKEESKDA